MKEAACYMLCQLAGKEANGANVRLPPPTARCSEVLGGVFSAWPAPAPAALGCRGWGRRGFREGACALQRKQNVARVAPAAYLRAFSESAAERSPKLRFPVELLEPQLPVGDGVGRSAPQLPRLPHPHPSRSLEDCRRFTRVGTG